MDTYTSPRKQYLMLKAILLNYEKSLDALNAGASFSRLIQLPVRERIGRAKYIREDALEEFDKIEAELSAQIAALTERGE